MPGDNVGRMLERKGHLRRESAERVLELGGGRMAMGMQLACGRGDACSLYTVTDLTFNNY